MTKAILILVLCALAGCSEKPQPQQQAMTEAALSDAQLAALQEQINQSGAECDIGDHREPIVVKIVSTPHLCIPLINQLPKLDTIFISCDGRVISTEDFSKLKTRPETQYFFILYGTLSKGAFTELANKFPNIEQLNLWGFDGSDLTALPPLSKLKKLRTDWDHLVTVEEAKRIALSENLEDIIIRQAESNEVFDILMRLPNLEGLAVSTYDAEGNETEYCWPE